MKATYQTLDDPERKADSMLSMVINQGYVPGGCLLNGQVVYLLVKQGEDACAGCNLNRAICNGRPKKCF